MLLRVNEILLRANAMLLRENEIVLCSNEMLLRSNEKNVYISCLFAGSVDWFTFCTGLLKNNMPMTDHKLCKTLHEKRRHNDRTT